jgi:ABC-type uncharacterized transport system ATPase subunit
LEKAKSPIVLMKDIVKIYPDGTIALRGVDLAIYPGEILGLLGENGAGKTTLMKILSGFLRPTRGEIYLRGRKVSFRSAADALSKGIGMVHQHLALVPVFTGYENIVLGLRVKGDARREIEKLMEETGLRVRLDVPVEQLSFGERQRIEILRMLLRRVDVLILDEPTTNLTPLETKVLFQALRRLRDNGKSVIFITHKLREVLEIADRIVVMRRGRVVGEVPREKAEPRMLARMMVGREVFLRIEKPPAKPGKPVLRVVDLWVRSDTGAWAVKGVSFEVRMGEIFGIAGVEGNGQAELVQAITGLRRVEKGKVFLMDVDVTNKEPGELYKLGVAHIPEDRRAMGLVLDMSVAENSVLGMHRWEQFCGKAGAIKWRNVYSHARRIIEEYEVVAPSLRSPVRYLSGGNQQKLLAGRELSKNPRLIVAAQPTRGLDVAATEYIRKLLVDLRTRGHAVLLVSADTDEVLQLSDRVAVMYDGRFTAVTRPEELTEEKLGLLMGGMEVKGLGSS